MEKVAIFIDYWNVQLNWNRSRNGRKAFLDWFNLPDRVMGILGEMYPSEFGDAVHVGTRLYVSSGRNGDSRFLAWLGSLSRRRGIMVIRRERGGDFPFQVKCRGCGELVGRCPSCGTPFLRARESQIDVSLAVDILSLAHQGVYTAGVLMSDDKDFAPALEEAARLGKKMVGFHWNGGLARHCWALVSVPRVARLLARSDKTAN